jgi:hypothetical protein
MADGRLCQLLQRQKAARTMRILDKPYSAGRTFSKRSEALIAV